MPLARCTRQLAQCALLALALSLFLNGCSINDQAVEGFLSLEGDNGVYIQEYCGARENLDMSNITFNIWWPGCGLIQDMAEFGFQGESCVGRCPRDGCIKMAVMQEMNAFNNEYGGQKVSYKSRPGTGHNGVPIEVVDLVGWWLPAPNASASTPRIVLQHGFTSNSNKYRTMFLAFMLRKMGYSVLVNNLRDHCYSANSSTHMAEWGHAYPYDVLGAWDYAKGITPPLPSAKVGILGISMGGFNALNALGLEPQIPGVWIDGAPYTPRGGLEIGFNNAVKEAGVGFIAGTLFESAWKAILRVSLAHGIDVNENLPASVLPLGPDTQRPVYVTANTNDNTVAFSEAVNIVGLLKSYPTKYALKEFWVNSGGCLNQTHSTDMMTQTEEYARRLKEFWSDVFDDAKLGVASASPCGTVAPTAVTPSAAPLPTAIPAPPAAPCGTIAPQPVAASGCAIPAQRYDDEPTQKFRVALPTWPIYALWTVILSAVVLMTRVARIRTREHKTRVEILRDDETGLLMAE